MRFLSENYLVLIPIFTVTMLILAILMVRRSRKKFATTFHNELLSYLTQSYSVPKARVILALNIITVTFLLLALARPQAGESSEKQKSEGLELMFVVDVSPSMLAEDVRPSRLEYVKIEINKLIDQLQGSKIGIVALSGVSSLICPMTPDPSALKMYIDGLSVDTVSNKGTDFKMAFAETLNAFTAGSSTSEVGSGASKVVVLFSDGENHEEGAEEEVKKMADEGLRLYTVTVGTEKGAAIPQRNNGNYLTDYKKDRSGQTVISTARPELMQSLAKAGNGNFYFFTAGGDQGKTLLADLDKLERGEFDSRVIQKYEEKYQIFLLLALISAFLSLMISTRSNLKLEWQGRFRKST